MAHNIDINVNFSSAIAGTQQMQDTLNQLKTTIDTAAGSSNKAKQSLTDYAGSYSVLSAEVKKTRADIISELAVLEKARSLKKQDADAINTQITKIKQLETTLRTQTQTLNQYNKVLGVTATQTQRATTSNESLKKSFNEIGAVLGVSAGIYGLFRAMQYGVKTIASFELEIAKLRSILGETKAGMDKITQSAIDIGANSIFGAKGVASLQIELAKMGFTKDEIMGMQQAIVDLATATQEDLASSAEVVANVIRTFNLVATDSTKVVDVMGKAFNDSALDLSNFREAIKYVAPIAAQANFKFEETVALLEQLSNAGLKGSLAGTGLTNIISRLGNENSKFSKTLGRTVDGYDDFIAGMIELKKRGADLGNTFELVDRRAAAAFTIILNGINTVEEFKKKLEDASGVMKQQASVQLDTITNSAKLAKNSFDSLVLSIDHGSGIVSTSIRTVVGEVASLVGVLSLFGTTVTEKNFKELEEKFYQLGIRMSDKLSQGIEDSHDKPKKALLHAVDVISLLLFGKSGGVSKSFTDSLDKSLKEGEKTFDDSLFNFANAVVKRYKEIYGKLFIEKIPELRAQESIDQKQFAEGSIEYINRAKIISLLDIEYNKYLQTLNLQTQSDSELEKAMNKRIDELELERKIEAEKIKIMSDGFTQKSLLIRNDYRFNKEIWEVKKEAGKAAAKDLELIQLTYLNDMLTADQEYLGKLIKQDEEALKKREDLIIKHFLKIAKDQADIRNKGGIQATEDSNKKLFWDAENPIAAWMGLADEEELATAMESFDLIKDKLTSFADAWVEQTDRIVEARNRQVEEAQQSLETEIALAQAGFASNVTLKRKELADIKKMRDEALAQQKKAQKAQLIIDTAMQVSSLGVSIAKLYEDGIKKGGILGIIASTAAVISLIALIASFKAKAQGISQTYAKGGEVGGRRHSQGGTMIEAEQGEYVISRQPYMKHKMLVDAINKDDQIAIDRAYFGRFKGGTLNVRASLDDSEDLKAIRKALETKGKEIQYFGSYRIEKIGGITTKIYTN
jgi:TP901 family phage tail tape measure protein